MHLFFKKVPCLKIPHAFGASTPNEFYNVNSHIYLENNYDEKKVRSAENIG